MNGKCPVNPYGQGLCHCGSLFCRLRSLSDHHSTPGSNTQVVPASQRSPAPSTDFLTSSKSGLPGITTTLSGTTLTVVMGNRSNPCLFDHSLGYFTNALIKKKNELFILAALGFSCGMRDLCCGMHAGSSSPTRDGIQAPALGAWSLTHWTTREVPKCLN